jgi:hypothetical protein
MSEKIANNLWNSKFLNLLYRSFQGSYLLVLLCSVFALLMSALIENAFAPISFAIFLVGLGAFICKIVFGKEQKKALRIFLYVIFLNFLFVIIIYYGLIANYGIPYMGESDSFHHDQYAETVLSMSNIGAQGAFLYQFSVGHSDSSFFYTGFITVLYKTFQVLGFEHHTLLPRFFNSFMLAFLALLGWRFALLVGCNQRVACVAGMLTGSWPLVVFHAAMIRRDVIFAYFLLIIVYFIVSFLVDSKRITLGGIAGCLFAVMIVSSLRFGFLAIIFMLGFGIYFLNIFSRLKKKITLFHIMIVFVSIFFVACVILVIIKSGYFGKNLGGLTAQFGNYVDSRSTESESGIGAAIFKLPILISMPLRLVYANIFPPPIPSMILIKNIRWVGTLFWVLCLPILIRQISSFTSNRGENSFVLRSVTFVFVILFCVVNLITFTEPHQMMYLPLGLVLICYGLQDQKYSIKKYLPFLLFFGCMFIGLYVALKML